MMEVIEMPLQRFSWGSYKEVVHDWAQKCRKISLMQRLWEKDASLWTRDAKIQKGIRERLGWLDVVSPMKELCANLALFSNEIRSEGFSSVVLLGMGGSSLAAEVFQSLFGAQAGFPSLLVLDSTDPEKIRQVEQVIDAEKTLFIVSSKSGGTIESLSLFKYFFGKATQMRKEAAGSQFVAVTNADTSLEDLAKKNNFRKIFLAPEDVGGRFSALTYFGLVPASLIGVEIARVLEAAEKTIEEASPNVPFEANSAWALGLGIAVLAEEGRDKLTILSTSSLVSLGDWIEQLIAESTGKEEMGIVPVVREPFESLEAYREDRLFVALLLDSDDREGLERHLEELEKAGHPVLTFRLREKTDIGAEFFRWEIAVAVACSLLKINAFDQPDVQAAKDRTHALLALPEFKPKLSMEVSPEDLKSFWQELGPVDYIAILAFLPDQSFVRARLEDLRRKIRERTNRTATLGFGPRYLHSTGQLHKGGPNTGNFLLITTAHEQGLEIPGEKYSFAGLELAQAVGDLEALRTKHRRVVHFHMDSFSEEALDELVQNVVKSLD